MDRAFFEDLGIGDRFGGERFVVDGDEMLAFARRWDPRPIHVDDAAGKEAGFGEAIASGAFTTSIYTLLSLRSREANGGHAVIAGLGSETKLPRPVRRGDVLEFRGEILNKRLSRSRSDAGVVETLGRLHNQNDEVVYESKTFTLVARRPSSN